MKKPSHIPGFSLLEILIVLSVISTFIGFSCQIGNLLKERSLNLKNSVRFFKYAAGLDEYKEYYGNYPKFINVDELCEINKFCEDFVSTLSGKNFNNSIAKNFNKDFVKFCEFEAEEFLDGKLIDAFGNTGIFFMIKNKLSLEDIWGKCNEISVKTVYENTNLLFCVKK